MAHQFFFNPYILDNLPAPNTGLDVVQDLSEPRLRMYVTSRGVKTFFVRKRVAGRDKRIIIGNYPDVDIEDARERASEILRATAQKPKIRRNKIEFKKLVDLYMVRRVRRVDMAREKLVRAINRHLSPLFARYVNEITSDDIAAVLGNISGPAIAGRIHELMQSIFKFAIEEGYVKSNPMTSVPKVQQNRRTRPLTISGLHRLVAAIESQPDANLRAAFMMLIFGFAPKSKIFAMRWRDLDFNHYMWGTMPLSDRATVLLQDLPQQDDDWVFPGRGGRHLTDPRHAWRAVAAAAGIDNLTMDDVHKFLMRRVVWASDKDDMRNNMNRLLDEVLMPQGQI